MASSKSKIVTVRLTNEYFALLEKRAYELKRSKGLVAKEILISMLNNLHRLKNDGPTIDLIRVHYKEIHRHKALNAAGVLEQIPGKSQYHLRVKKEIPQSEITRIKVMADLDFEKKYK